MSMLPHFNDCVACPYIYLHLIRLADRLEKRTSKAKTIQLRVFDRLIKLNGQSEFGQEYGLGRVRDYKGLVSRVPVSDYETYRPYVERMIGGENQALLGGGSKPLMFALTSGTTGQPKKVPVSSLFLKQYRWGWDLLISRLWKDHHDLWYRQIFQLSSPADDYVTASGVPCGSISGMTAKMQNWLAKSYYAVPVEVCYISETASRYYAAVRMAIENDVALIITASPATLIGMARSVQQRTEELLRDVRDGSLSASCEIPGELRARLSEKLRPNPALARELGKKAGPDGLWPRDYWRVAVIGCWLGGTMGLYIPLLREMYGNPALRDIGLLASEGRMCIPLSDGTPDGLLDIDNNFYEFIPAEQMENWQGPGLMGHELQVGQKYFILLTTPSGFFRYNISDVVEVTGYIGEAPLIRFLNKGSRISSVVGEKLSEHNVVQAIEQAYRKLGNSGSCDELVLCPQWGDPPYYRLNVDPAVFGGRTGGQTQEELAEAVDQELMDLNIEYDSKRKTKRLGAIQLRMLHPGYLAQCDRQQMAVSVTARSQFKHRYLHTELGADKDFPVLEQVKPERVEP